MQIRQLDNGNYQAGLLNSEYKYDWGDEFSDMVGPIGRLIKNNLTFKSDHKKKEFVDSKFTYNPITKSYHEK